MQSGQYLKSVLGSIMYFFSECWAKIVIPGEARQAPPTVATTLYAAFESSYVSDTIFTQVVM